MQKLTQDLPTTAFSRLLAEKRTKAAAVQATQEEQQKLQPTQFIKEVNSLILLKILLTID